MQNAEIVTTCPFLYAHDVLTVAGHQHGSIFQGQAVGAGIRVIVEYDGTELLSGRAGPWAVLGPLAVARDTGLTFTCAFDNRGSEPIGHGSTEFDEMCRIFGWLTRAERPVIFRAVNNQGQTECDTINDNSND